MDYIKLKGNNGSVPNPYYRQFSLTFFADGNSALIITSGRPPEDSIIDREKKTFSLENIAELMTEAQQLSLHYDDSAMVGGPEKFIEINRESRIANVLTVRENTDESKFFFKCIDFYNADLKQRLADIL
jgi:hypothetical protein